MAKARGAEFNKKLVSVIGDSTFMHSGITGLIDIVYNKGNNTVIILDNSITGMTGHQDNPTTGYTIRGEETKQVNLLALCKAVGIEYVTVADPFDIKNVEKIVKEETDKEPSPVKAFGNYRKKFVEMYYPRLCKKAKVENPADFYLNIVKAAPIKKG
jgi:indolepyruvate ferredoxin oxidoreductase alpha subunit